MNIKLREALHFVYSIFMETFENKNISDQTLYGMHHNIPARYVCEVL